MSNHPQPSQEPRGYAPVQRRAFNTAERVALYVNADGRCSSCGTELDSGWHADHVHPWAKGGPTDLANGQAMCPACNLRKGSRTAMTSTLRQWQQRALSRAIERAESGESDFLAVACPGAGKTTWALTVAEELVRRRVIDLVVVVVPSDELRSQWARNTSTGLSLREYDLRDVVVRKRGYDGVVTTYQALGGKTAGMLQRELGDRALVILDEIHHAADQASYGENLHYAFDRARFRLMLTGTPWRTNKRDAIPFVSYDQVSRELEVDFSYDYGNAITDGVCRPIQFPVVNGYVEYKKTRESEVAEVTMSADLDLPSEDRSDAMRALLDPAGGWMTAVLTQAHQDLLSHRREVPDAGGLVVARDQVHAYLIRDCLRPIVGADVRVVVSGADDAKADIDRFRRSHEPWIIAVRMIAEGVDIPRLTVGVYATNYQTKMFFTQVVGRFVRTRAGEKVTATMYVPPDGMISRYAHDIEKLSKYALDERESAEREYAGDMGVRGPSEFLTLGTEALGLDHVVASGQSIDGATVLRWREKLRTAGVPEHYAANLAASENAPALTAERKPRSVIEKEMRKEITDLVGKVAHHVFNDRNAAQGVNAALWNVFGVQRAKATIEELERQRTYLTRWLAEGVQPWAS